MRHYRITIGDAIAAHERAIALGGHPNIQDIGLVEAAIARPYNGYYWPIYRKAAALMESISTNHGFIDGNKRTAYMLTYLMLNKSGYNIRQTSSIDDMDDVEHLILDLTTHFLSLDEVAHWLKARIYRY